MDGYQKGHMTEQLSWLFIGHRMRHLNGTWWILDTLVCAVLQKFLHWICSEKALAVTNNSGVAAATEWWVEIYRSAIMYNIFGITITI